jgi:hypothetical protein
LEILAGWAAVSPTDAALAANAALAGTAFMASYLSPSSSGVGTTGPLGPLSSSAQAMGGLSSLSARVSAPPPLSVSGGFGVPGVLRGVRVQGGSSFSGPGVADPQGSSSPRRTSTGSSRSLHTDPGELRGGTRPPPFMAFHTDPGGFGGGLGLLPSWLLLPLARLILPLALLRLGGPIPKRMPVFGFFWGVSLWVFGWRISRWRIFLVILWQSWGALVFCPFVGSSRPLPRYGIRWFGGPVHCGRPFRLDFSSFLSWGVPARAGFVS